jgi:ABC-2 type transport system ATP-binding protein
MRQRLGLAQALLHDPPLVILDEPMSGLDPRGRRDVRDLMVELRERGKTVFFSTHILSDVESICDRVGMLRRGELVKAGALHEIVRDQVQGVEVAFDGAPESVAQDARRRRPRPEGGVLAEVATQPDADRLVDAVREAGGSVLAVTPLRESLEDVFLQLEPKDDGEVKEEASQEAAS